MFNLRSIVIGIVLMLKKYTCINVTVYAESNDEDYQNGIVALPLIGFAIGFIAMIISSLRVFYDEFFISILILIFYNIVTKIVNMKDSFRTLNYYLRPKNQTDQLTGIIGIILINLMYFSLFRIVPNTALLITFVSGYSSLIILSSVIKRNKENTSIMKYCHKHHVIAAFGISFFIAAIFNYRLVISLSLTYMILAIIVSMLDDRIEIFPSSMEGAIIEITQIVFLTITYLMKL